MNIYCIEQNYIGHKRERENLVAGEPFVFVKPASALLPPETPFIFDRFSDCRLYGQVEVVVRMSQSAKNISIEEAAFSFDSITTGINFTAIDIHAKLNNIEVPWHEGKGWNNSSVTGLWLPATDFPDKKDINFCLYQNREMAQMANTELMLHDINSLIAFISLQHELKEGDLIFTGAPLGIVELMEGDQLEAFIEDDSNMEFEIMGK